MSKSETEKRDRIENYERLRAEMGHSGFKEKICTISVLKANILAIIITAPIIAVCLAIYNNKWGGGTFSVSPFRLLLFVIIMIAGFVVHEVLHGLTWGLFCKKKWKSIHLGVMWNQLTPYCHCKEMLSWGSYIFGGLMPLLVLGIGLFISAFLMGNMMLLGISLINILSAGGDITIVFMLLKHKNTLVFDHPTECGFIAFFK
jgi:hypothetical protein